MNSDLPDAARLAGEPSRLPAYTRLTAQQWRCRIARAYRQLRCCRLCPRQCRVDRSRAQQGFCQTGIPVPVAHWQRHYGEEPPLSAAGGAGTIFFARCTLRCVYCQNYQISQELTPAPRLSVADLAECMLALQRQGAQNIDLVSPQHVVPQIIAATCRAAAAGLRIPLVYNSNGYDTAWTLALLNDIVDIYLPDLKYDTAAAARRYSGVADYAAWARPAVLRMRAQVGDLDVDGDGRAWRGILVRHLVLPGQSDHSCAIIRWLRQHCGATVAVSIMSQYAPRAQADSCPEINRTVRPAEYEAVIACADAMGFTQAWMQELSSNEQYFPDFSQADVFSPPAGGTEEPCQ